RAVERLARDPGASPRARPPPRVRADRAARGDHAGDRLHRPPRSRGRRRLRVGGGPRAAETGLLHRAAGLTMCTGVEIAGGIAAAFAAVTIGSGGASIVLCALGFDQAAKWFGVAAEIFGGASLVVGGAAGLASGAALAATSLLGTATSGSVAAGLTTAG